MSVYRFERANNQARRAYVAVAELEFDECEKFDEHPAYAKWARWAALAEDIYLRLSPDDRKSARSLVN